VARSTCEPAEVESGAQAEAWRDKLAIQELLRRAPPAWNGFDSCRCTDFKLVAATAQREIARSRLDPAAVRAALNELRGFYREPATT